MTVIEGLNAQGWSIPPFTIMSGQNHFSTWYDEDLPQDWILAVSENGWTTNELGFQWIRHFHKPKKHTHRKWKSVTNFERL